jgi:hypothetical protein
MVLTILLIHLVILTGTVMRFDAGTFPAVTPYALLSGEWADDVESYLTQHLGFHDTLFRIKSRADLFVGEKMIQGVYITDDMLLEKSYSEELPEAETLAAPPNEFARNYGIPTFLLLVPSASEIYETLLPANAVSTEEQQRIKEIYAATATNVRCTDACHVLSSLRSDYIYYRTDTHWTCFGAFAVYQNMIQRMGFTPVPYQRYVISHLSTEFRGDLYARTLYGGVMPDMLDCYRYDRGSSVISVMAYYANGTAEDRGRELYDADAVKSGDMYRFYLGTPCDRLVIRTNVESGKKLLLFKDDFADCMVPFLLQHYSEICIVDLELTGDRWMTAADPADYTQALFLCSMKNWEKLWG